MGYKALKGFIIAFTIIGIYQIVTKDFKGAMDSLFVCWLNAIAIIVSKSMSKTRETERKIDEIEERLERIIK